MSRAVSGRAIMAGATFRHSFPRARSASDQNGHRLQGLALPRPTTARALDQAVLSRAFRRGGKGTAHSGTWGPHAAILASVVTANPAMEGDLKPGQRAAARTCGCGTAPEAAAARSS